MNFPAFIQSFYPQLRILVKTTVMRRHALLIFSLFTILTACGQPLHQDATISKGDSTTLRFYEVKSSQYKAVSADSAVYFADQGLRLARRLHYRLGEGRMLDRLARINEQYGNLKLAGRYQQAALHLFHSLNALGDSTNAIASQGLLAARQGNVSQGEQLVTRALEQYRQSKNTKGMISAYTKLGELNELSGHTSQALACYS